MIIYFVAMAMPFVYFITVNALRQSAGLDRAALRAEAHGAAQIRIIAACLDLAVAVAPFGDQRDHRVFGLQIKFRAVRISHARNMARILDHSELHPQANTEIRHFIFARKTDR